VTPKVFVGGYPVETLGVPVTELTLACEWPDGSGNGVGGPVSGSFGLLLPANKRPGWLAKGALAEVRFGGQCLLAGQLAEPDWANGAIAIDGASMEGVTSLCLDGSGNLSSTPDTVLDAAITRGALTWNRPASISATALTSSDTTLSLNYVTDMLGEFARRNTGTRLYVDAGRSLRAGTDPTTPELFILPGAGELPWVSQDQATRLAGRWQDASGVLSTTFVGSGAVEKPVNLLNKGPLTSTSATALLNSALAQLTAGGWGGGLILSSSHFLGAVHLADVFGRAARGLMVRNLGQRDPRPDRLPIMGVDFIVDRAEWRVAENVIALTPRGMVARDFSAVLSSLDLTEDAA
jgi:hypothetical protein